MKETEGSLDRNNVLEKRPNRTAVVGSPVRSSWRGYSEWNLFSWVLDDLFDIGVEPEIPETDGLHELLRRGHLALVPEEGLDKLDAGVAAELRAPSLARAEHGLLAGLEELAEPIHEALAGFDEVVDDLPVFLGPDLGEAVLGTLDLAGQLDELEPQVAGDLGDGGGSGSSLLVDGPVKDPFAQGVGIENATQ